MSDLFSRVSRAKLERIRRSAAALPSWLRRVGYYGLALLFVAAAATLRWMLPDVLGPTPFLAFYLAWVGAAAFGGLGPGLFATVASWLCIEVLFDYSPGQALFGSSTESVRFMILMAGGLTISLVAERMRRGRLRERRQRQQLADLSQLTGLGQLLIRDDQDRITFWSEGCIRLYGFTAEQAVGRVSHELLKTEFSQPLETIRATLRKTGRWEGEQTHRRADGSVVHVASLWILRDGTARTAVLEVNNDITARKHAEAAVREARNGLEVRVQERTAQLQTAKELVESERQRFRDVLDQLPAYLVLLTPDYRVAFANRFFEQRFGKCEGRRCYEYLFQRTERCENCNAYEVLKTHAPQHWEWIGPDGRNYDIHDFPFTDVDGAPLIMEVGLDITDRKQAEKALRESEQRLKLAQQIARVGTFDWDIRTGVNAWTPALEALYGLPPGGFAGTEAVWEQLVHPQDRAATLRLVEQAFETGEPTEGEWRVVWPDGSVHWLAGRWQVLKDESGEPVRMTGVNIDITERIQAEAELARHREHLEELVQERSGQLATVNSRLQEQTEELAAQAEALRQSEQRLSLAQQIAHVGTFDLDIRTGVNVWTPELEAMHGLPPEGFGKTRLAWEQLVHPQDRAEASRLVERSLDTGEPTEGQWRVVWPDGSVHWLAGHWQVFKDESGKPYRMTGVNIDITDRKHAEEALRRSERQFKSTFENAAIGIAHVALDGHIRRFNSRFCEIAGYQPDEITRKTCEQITVAEDWKAEKEQLRRLLDGEVDHYSIEKRYLRMDGSAVWVNLTRSIQHNDTGKPEYFIVLVEDISARKHAEEALRASEYRFRRLFEANLAGVYITKLDGTIIDFNDSMMRMLGYDSREEMFQHKSTDFFADPEFRRLLLYLLARDGYVPAKEAVLQRKDGSVLYALGAGVLLVNEQTGEPYIQGVAIDITERRQAEEALRESEARLQLALSAGRMGTWVWDLDTDTVDTDPLHRRLWDLNDADVRVPASMILRRIHPEDRARTFDRESAHQMLDGPLDMEFRIVRRDGSVTWLQGSVVPIRDADGVLRKVIGVNFDITERKRVEETTREWNATLENKVAERTAQLQHRARQLQKLTLELSETEDRERKRMAEILHDDLQQQLAAAKFHLGMLRGRARYDASLQATAAQIDHMLMEAIQKSRGLSHELSPAVMHHADFAETLRWLANQVQAKHGLVVHVQATGEVHSPSETLKGFLYKTAQELLFNVVKHARVNEAQTRVRQYGGYICLTVSDRGRGFNPQELRDAPGFGLLNIRERIELLGGRMKIKSAPGKGSAFFIAVPAGEQVTAPLSAAVGVKTSQPEAARPPGEGRLRVLLADDHEIVRQGLIAVLSEEHTIEIVGEAANGREAVDLADRLHPDVVIMDVSMPLIDGDAATRQIKTLRPGTRVIALSMYEEPAKKEMMRKAGAESYVLKTAPSEELLAAIRGRTATA